MRADGRTDPNMSSEWTSDGGTDEQVPTRNMIGAFCLTVAAVLHSLLPYLLVPAATRWPHHEHGRSRLSSGQPMIVCPPYPYPLRSS